MTRTDTPGSSTSAPGRCRRQTSPRATAGTAVEQPRRPCRRDRLPSTMCLRGATDAAPLRAHAGEGSVAGPTRTASRAEAPPGRDNRTRSPVPARLRCASSRVERQHRIRPHDELLAGPHVKDRRDGTASDWVGAADLVDAVHASPSRPQPQNPTGSEPTAHLELEHTAHVTVGAPEDTWIAGDTRDKERRHVELKPAAASILREGCAHRAGLGLRLELTDQLCMPLDSRSTECWSPSTSRSRCAIRASGTGRRSSRVPTVERRSCPSAPGTERRSWRIRASSLSQSPMIIFSTTAWVGGARSVGAPQQS
jgi:hypothetical protein